MVVPVWLLDTTVMPSSAMTSWLVIVGAGSPNPASHAAKSKVYGSTASGSCTNVDTPCLPSDDRGTGLSRHRPHHPRHQLRQLPSVHRPQPDREHQRRRGAA